MTKINPMIIQYTSQDRILGNGYGIQKVQIQPQIKSKPRPLPFVDMKNKMESSQRETYAAFTWSSDGPSFKVKCISSKNLFNVTD